MFSDADFVLNVIELTAVLIAAFVTLTMVRFAIDVVRMAAIQEDER